MVEEAKRYHIDIVGISSTKKRGFGTVDVNGEWKLLHSGADPYSLSAQASVEISQARLSDCGSDWISLILLVCMLKLKVMDRTLCLLQVFSPNASSEYQAFVDKVNDDPVWYLLLNWNRRICVEGCVRKTWNHWTK